MPEPSILIVRSSRRCTGLERGIVRVAQAARDAGFAVRIAALYRAGPSLPATHPLIELARAGGVPAVQVSDAAPLSIATLSALRALIRDSRPAVIHTHDYRSNALALLACRLAGHRARLVATSHGHTGADLKLRLYEALDRRLLRAFDRVIGVSHYQCQRLRSWGLDAARIVYIPHGVEPAWDAGVGPAERETLRRAWGASRDDFLVGFFGRDSREKGLETLRQALRRAQAVQPHLRLIVAGEGSRPPGRPQGATPRDEATLAVGYQEDVRPVLLACDVIAIPSEREAFGLVALEALALGRPLLASDVGGLPEIVRRGVTGWLAPAGDVAAWTSALLEIAAAAGERQSRAERGRADVLERFPACRNWQGMVALYRELA